MNQKYLTLFLVLGLVALVPVAYSATQQIFQAGAGLEIVSDGTAVFDITSTSTTGGSIHIRTRNTGTGIFVEAGTNEVGIGTTTPGQKLDVAGNINATGNITADGNLTANVSAAQVSAGTFGSVAGKGNYRYDAAASANPVLFVDATNERVGIGTTGPGSKLQVAGGAMFNNRIALGNAGTAPGAPNSGSAGIWYNLAGLEKAFVGLGDASLLPTDAWGVYTSSNGWSLGVLQNGNVGIGTTAPAVKLHVNGRVYSAGANAEYNFIGWDSTDLSNAAYLFIGPRSTGWHIIGSNKNGTGVTRGLAFAIGPNDTIADAKMVIDTTGNVGIGTTGPGAKLDITAAANDEAVIVTGYSLTGASANALMDLSGTWNTTGHPDALKINITNTGSGALANLINLQVGGTSRFYVRKDGVIEATVPSAMSELRLTRSGTLATNDVLARFGALKPGTWLAYQEVVLTSAVSGAESTKIDVHTNQGGSNITSASFQGCSSTCLVVGGGSGKLDAGTVDPVYTIGGKRYATYMAGMTGVKEETAGVLNLRNKQYVIDFEELEEGSDLWLFAQTVNVDGRSFIAGDGKVYSTTAEELFDNMTVLLTPGFEGRVWYEKDVESKRITIFGDKNGEVSYRLTAPRFDWKGWSNQASEGEHEGFNLDNLLR